MSLFTLGAAGLSMWEIAERGEVSALRQSKEHSLVTLTIELSDERQAVLAATARAQGVSAEQYKRQVLEQALEAEAPRRRHIAEVILENMQDVSPEAMATMPEDGASQHDHYIYGWPKREP
jgi:hypothetical protein